MAKKNKILVFGDLILDKYIHGTATRLSPEAPVPVIDITSAKTTTSLGGAANVAANIRSLGGEVEISGTIGTDDGGEILRAKLDEIGVDTELLLRSTERCTTVKTRILASEFQIARLDSETRSGLDCRDVQQLQDSLKEALPDAAAVVISDYAKGTVVGGIVRQIMNASHHYGFPVFIDPKTRNTELYHPTYLDTVAVLTPNLQEAIGMLGLGDDAPLETVGNNLLRMTQFSHVLITLGAQGMALFTTSKNGTSMVHLPTTAKAVFDVSGAGDTVIAILALGFSRGMSMSDAARLANLAAGVVVSKRGTATVTREELLQVSLEHDVPIFPTTIS
jgi:rfaE bifunctional protein kinase chain/domain